MIELRSSSSMPSSPLSLPLSPFSSPSPQCLLRLLDGRTACFDLPTPLSLSALQLHIEHAYGIPAAVQRLHCDGRLLRDSALSLLSSSLSLSSPPPPPIVCVSLSLSLLGGKGGFGSLLRATTSAVGVKRTSDFSAMRDLHGRRLRHVEQERAMEEWTAQHESKTEEERKAEKTQLHQRLANVQRGRRAERPQCRWGQLCRYRDTCRKLHPDQMQEDERKDGGAGARGRKRRKGEAGFPLVDDSWQAQLVDEEEMQGDIEEGILAATRRHSKEGGGEHSSGDGDELVEEEEEQKEPLRRPLSCAREAEAKEAEEQQWEEREEKEEAEAAVVAAPSRRPLPLQPPVSFAVGEERKDGTADGAAATTALATSSPSPSSTLLHPVSVAPPSSADVLAAVSSSCSSFPAVDLSQYASASALQVLGLAALKAELSRRGLKCGGSLSERAERLWLCKARSLEQLPRRLWASNSN